MDGLIGRQLLFLVNNQPIQRAEDEKMAEGLSLEELGLKKSDIRYLKNLGILDDVVLDPDKIDFDKLKAKLTSGQLSRFKVIYTQIDLAKQKLRRNNRVAVGWFTGDESGEQLSQVYGCTQEELKMLEIIDRNRKRSATPLGEIRRQTIP